MKLHNEDQPSFPEFSRGHNREEAGSWVVDRLLEERLDRKTQAMRKKIDLANAEFRKRKAIESKLIGG